MNLLSFNSQALAYKIDETLKLKNSIDYRAIGMPKVLNIWTPFPTEPAYLDPENPDPPKPPKPAPKPQQGEISTGGGSSAGMAIAGIGAAVPLLIGGGMLAFFLTKGSPGLKTIPPQLNPRISYNDTLFDNIFNFNYGEEVNYNMIFKNTEQTPIYSDSVLYLKLPDWLEYIPDSFTVNDIKLTDEVDKDMLAYFKDEKMLVLQIGLFDTQEGALINFTAKVLTETVSPHEPFCTVKFQSISKNYQSKWIEMSLQKDRTLPPEMVDVINKKL